MEQIKIFKWKVIEETWDEKYEELKLFISKNGRLPSSSPKRINEKSLGNWVVSQKQNYYNKIINETKIEKLNMLDCWVWDNHFDNIWNINYNKLIIFVDINTNILDENKMIKTDNKSYQWLLKQRYYNSIKKLKQERLGMLVKIGAIKIV